MAASALIVVAVAAVVLTAGASHRAPRHVPAVGRGGAAVLRNVYPAPLPPRPVRLVCDSPLAAPSGGTSPSGEAEFYTVPPTRTEMLLTVRGLRRIGVGDVYAVWVLPAVQSVSGEPAAILCPAGTCRCHRALGWDQRAPEGRDAASSESDWCLQTPDHGPAPHSPLRLPGAITLQGFINF